MAITQPGCFNLEEELIDKVTPDDFFADDEAYFSVAGAAYPALYSFMSATSLFAAQEVSSDEVIVPTRGTDWFEGGHWERLHTHEYICADPTPGQSWFFLYQGINECERTLALLAKATSPEVASYQAEVKMLRTLFYYWLLDLFGNVPILPEEYYSLPAGSYYPVTAPRKEVYEYVEKQILENLLQLAKTVGPQSYGRMHYYAGQSLLAALYLNAEVYTGQAQWEKALAACNEVINSGYYDLSQDYFDNFKTENSGSIENIFVIPYDQSEAPGFNLHMMTLHYESRATYDFQSQPWNGFCSLQEFYESYDTLDARRKSFIVGPQYDRDGNPILDFGADNDDPDGPAVNFTPEIQSAWYSPGNPARTALRQEGARIGKFEYKIGATDNLDNDFPLFRYAEILLNKAETLWRLNPADPMALELVNQIRERAGVEPFSVLNAENLLAERGREMAFEAKRRTDLIRFGVYGETWAFKPVSDPCKTIFPIPCPALEVGSNLQQNPCY